MSYWIYKCNSKNASHQNHFGDWTAFFNKTRDGGVLRWGTSEIVPRLADLETGDTVIAHQTDRNELVGVARVIEMKRCGEYLDVMLAPVEEIGVKVRPLKKSDERIGELDALRPGPIKTIYDISPRDAKYFLAKARAAKK